MIVTATQEQFQEAYAKVQPQLTRLQTLYQQYMPIWENASKYYNGSVAGAATVWAQDPNANVQLSIAQKAKMSSAKWTGRISGGLTFILVILVLSLVGNAISSDSALFTLWIPLITSIAAGVIVGKKARDKAIEKILQAENNKTAKKLGETEPFIQQGLGICNEIFNVMQIVPQNYAHPKALAYFSKYFASGRADSLKEAINLYEIDQEAKQDFQYLYSDLEERLRV